MRVVREGSTAIATHISSVVAEILGGQHIYKQRRSSCGDTLADPNPLFVHHAISTHDLFV